MNINEIRDEIPKLFNGNWHGGYFWLRKYVDTDYKLSNDEPMGEYKTAARILVDWAYEAGKAEGHICDEGCCESKWELGFEAAAKDPKAWYVLDKNGEQVHIGDTVKSGDTVKEITGLGNDELFSHWWSGSPASSFEKVIPDTRDKIKEDLANQFSAIMNDGIVDVDEDLRALAEEFIARIEALEE